MLLPKSRQGVVEADRKSQVLSLSSSHTTSRMSQQKILLNYAEFKKLKEVEQRYHELQNQIAGNSDFASLCSSLK